MGVGEWVFVFVCVALLDVYYHIVYLEQVQQRFDINYVFVKSILEWLI